MKLSLAAACGAMPDLCLGHHCLEQALMWLLPRWAAEQVQLLWIKGKGSPRAACRLSSRGSLAPTPSVTISLCHCCTLVRCSQVKTHGTCAALDDLAFTVACTALPMELVGSWECPVCTLHAVCIWLLDTC